MNAGRANPRIVARVWHTVSGSSMGRTPNPFSARRMGIRLIHPNPKAITRKAVTGWRAIRCLSLVEELEGWWFSVAGADIIHSFFLFFGTLVLVGTTVSGWSISSLGELGSVTS
jgi:hypothetical protein